MQIDFEGREITVKLVYYGPALSGKTTNLQALHRLISDRLTGRLMTLETRDDRTLFFDLLPVAVKTKGGIAVRFKVFTVPGQLIHNATRRIVLQGADGTAFIADSQISETKANRDSFQNLLTNLEENGIDPASHPIVLQFNKRDLPNIRPDAEIEKMAKSGKEPVFRAVAIRGTGVLETFVGLIERTWEHLESVHSFHKKFAIEPTEFLTELKSQLGVDA